MAKACAVVAFMQQDPSMTSNTSPGFVQEHSTADPSKQIADHIVVLFKK